MKSLAHRFVWWPGMDHQFEETVKACPECQQAQLAAPVSPLCSWQWPTWPWSHIHIDFAGPMNNQTFLIIHTQNGLKLLRRTQQLLQQPLKY